MSEAPPRAPSALELCTQHLPVDSLPQMRIPCARCGTRRQWLCGECLLPCLPDGMEPPRVELPLRVDILRGREESDTKSSANAAVIVAPEHARVWHLPEFPVYEDPSRVLLLFPSPTSVAISELEDLEHYEAIILVDTTWQRVGGVMQTLTQPFKAVHLGSYRTLFWRHQAIGEHCLSSIESLYFALREFDAEKRRRQQLKLDAEATAHISISATGSGSDSSTSAAAAAAAAAPIPPQLVAPYDGRFDNLLLFFLATYSRVQYEYKEGSRKGMKFTGKMRAGYIQGSAAAAASSASATAAASPATDGEGSGSGAGAAEPAEDVSTAEDGGDHANSSAGGGGGGGGMRRIRGAWAVRTDIMDQSAATLIRQRNDRFIQEHMVAEEVAAGRAQADVAQFLKITAEQRHEYGIRAGAQKVGVLVAATATGAGAGTGSGSSGSSSGNPTETSARGADSGTHDEGTGATSAEHASQQ